jgi:hypothetical protein
LHRPSEPQRSLQQSPSCAHVSPDDMHGEQLLVSSQRYASQQSSSVEQGS